MSASIAWALNPVLNSSLQSEYFSDTENNLEVTSWGGWWGGGRRRGGEGGGGVGRGYIEVGEEEVQTIGYKISYKDLLYKMGNIANIL